MERTIGAIAGMVDEARQHAWRRSRRWGRPGCGRLPTAPTSSRRSGRALVSTSRSSPGTRRRGSPTWRPWLGSAGPRVSRRVRHRRRQLAVHVRTRRPGRRAVQRRRGRRPVHGALRPGRGGLRGRAGRGSRRDRRRPRPSRRAAGARRARRPWAGPSPTSPRSSTACRVRRGRRAGHRARPRRDRPADRALPRRAAPTSVVRSSACSPSAPRSSSRVPASFARCSTSSATDSLTVSDRGLRHGVLMERFGS